MANALLLLAVFSLAADDRPVACSLACDGNPPATVVVGADADRVERTAVAKFVAGVRRDSQATLPVAAEPGDAGHTMVVIGTAKSNPVLSRLAKVHKLLVAELGEEDFLLRTLVDDSRACLVIAGGGPRGVLYGAQEAFEQVVNGTPDNHVYAIQCNLTRSPSVAVRGTYCLTCWGGSPRYPRAGWEQAIDSMADAGMNRVMFWVDGLFRSERHPGAFLKRSGQRYQDTPITHDDIRRLISHAHDRGMDFYFGAGVFSWFTAEEYLASRFEEAVDPYEKRALCPSNPVAQRVTLEYLSEMIEVFPKADGYMLEIRDERGECKCDGCQQPLDKRGSKQFGQSELDFLDKLTSAIWDKHPETKFIWLIGYAAHHDDFLYYERIRRMGGDPRLEWLDVRNSWTLPGADGGREPLREFSPRVYHWTKYHGISSHQMQDQVLQTVSAGLDGLIPAYEPGGFKNCSIYRPHLPEPFPVRLLPFSLTQFYYRGYTWTPKMSREDLVSRAHRTYFSPETPRQLADDLFFLERFMVAHLPGLNRTIDVPLALARERWMAGLKPPKGRGLLGTVDDIWTGKRRSRGQTKRLLLKSVAAEIRRFQDMSQGKGDMVRVLQIEERIAELRPRASRRANESFDLMQRAIDDMRDRVEKSQDYAAEAAPALARIDEYLAELKRREAETAAKPR